MLRCVGFVDGYDHWEGPVEAIECLSGLQDGHKMIKQSASMKQDSVKLVVVV